MEKYVIITICCAILMIVLIILVGVIWFGPQVRAERKLMAYCEDRLDKCNLGIADCLLSCDGLNLEYYRFDNGGFASDECWCKINNGTKQIW